MMSRVILLLAFWPTLALAQSPPASPATSETFVVPRLNGPIDLDGRVDEPAWDAIEPLPLITHWPSFGDAPSEPTEIRLAYDDAYIYVSCRCYAPPEAVFAASFKRDLNTLGTDYLALGLDTYNDNTTGVGFWASPTGSRTDGTFANDDGNFDDTWNTFWDAEVTVTPEGWFAEMRVPFSSLRYQPVDGRVMMGLSAWRYLGKKNEMDIFPDIPPTWGFWSFNKASQFQKVVFEGIETRRPVYITPYALGGLGQSFDLNDPETAYVRTDDPVTELGGDLKMSLTDNLTLDLTLNTDFAQVEADNQQVNLTRFSLFFPEKRQFFLERASLFDVNLGGSNRLFYSRRIGLHDGQAVRLLGGGRLVGRVGPWDVGVINLQTGRITENLDPADALGSENFGVLRLRRQVLNANSTAGGMLASRVSEDGAYNVAVGLDTDLRVFGESFLTVNWVQTFDDEVDAGLSPLDVTRMRARLERRAYVGTSYALGIARSGREYRPDMGFEQREDYTALRGLVSQGWGSSPGSPFARHQVSASTLAYFRNEGGTAETVENRVGWEGQLTSGAFFNVGVDVVYEDLLEAFDLSDAAEVLPGEYTFVSASAGYQSSRGGTLSFDINAGLGGFYDGWRATAGFAPRWIVSKHLELNGGYDLNRIRFPDREQTFTAHLGSIRALAALNTRFSLAAFLQYNSAANAGAANIRFRYNPQEGTDFFLVINSGFNTDRLREVPALPPTDNRTILAKYTYTFTL